MTRNNINNSGYETFFAIRFNPDLEGGNFYRRNLSDCVDALIMLGAVYACLHIIFTVIVDFFYRSQIEIRLIEMYQQEDAVIYPGDHKEVEKKLLHIRTCNFIWMHWMAENIPCWKYIANCCCNNYD